MKSISEIILKAMGWELVGEFPELNKSVVVLAPHTSNWDFVIGRLYLNAKGINNHTLMKKEMFFFPLNIILKALGAIPVDRNNKKTNVVSQLSSSIKNSQEFNLFIAPEGTRKKTNQWKRGFFHIAHEAGVPIVMSYIDYKNKMVGIEGVVADTNDIDTTMNEINDFYNSISAKYPENFTLDKRTN